ncbi:post-transcriptional regulator [Cohnella pontilimi]|nr:post-transcriptional regulator [Cohnella pontilimi]
MNEPGEDRESLIGREEMTDEQMNRMIEELCDSKAEEFRLIGYERVTGADVWECVSDKYHKKGMPPLYEVVNDILSLKVTQFMNFITLNMYRGDMRKG